MILNTEQITSITNEGSYECIFSKQRFSLLFSEDPSPIGSIIVFESPLTIGPVHFDKSVVICGELPNTNIFGGVCFQRLFSAQLGSMLSDLLGEPCYIKENCLFVDEKQTSITIVNQVKSSAMFHVFLPLSINLEGEHGLYELKLTEEQITQFKQHCVDCFHFFTKSLFLETQRDNI
jgi:hypothetical protein